jgi:hypothetical protein
VLIQKYDTAEVFDYVEDLDFSKIELPFFSGLLDGDNGIAHN